MNNEDWLKSLQPKDRVIVRRGRHVGVGYVERVTTTLIRLEPWTEERSQEVKAVRLRQGVRARLENLTRAVQTRGDDLLLPAPQALSDAITAAQNILDKTEPPP